MQALSNGFTFANPIFGRSLQARLLREALKVGEPLRVGVAFCLELGYLGTLGTKGHAQAIALGERAVALGSRLGYGRIVGHANAGMALATYLCGRWRKALEYAREGERVLREEGSGVRWELDLTEMFLSTCQWMLGDVRELVRLVSIYLRDAEERGDFYAQRGLRGWRTNVAWLAIGQPDEARAQLAAVEKPLQPGQSAQISHYYEAVSATLIDLYQGDGASAHARIEALWPAFDKAMLTRIQSVAVECGFLRARAALALAGALPAGERAPLLAQAQTQARVIGKQDTGWGNAFAHTIRAGAARLGGDAAREAACLRDAAAAYDATEMALYAAATRRRLGSVLGGVEGASMSAAADAFMREQGVADVSALSRMMLGVESI
jgi:eukaryotic-like serine/threonine-protein kinase